METIKRFAKYPKLAEFCYELRKSENKSDRHKILAYDLEFYPNKTLGIKGETIKGKFPVSIEAEKDLAKLVKIPAPYFMDCESELKALSFNNRLHQKVPAEKTLQIVLREGVIDRISNPNLLPTYWPPILNTISNSIPDKIEKESLRVIKNTWNKRPDISIISPSLNCIPLKGDIVAFGINISEGSEESIQVKVLLLG